MVDAGTANRSQRGGPPVALGVALRGMLQRRGLFREIEDRKAMEAWGEVAGPTLAGDSWPLRIEKGVLWIAVNNAPLANHLCYLRPMLLRRIRERFPTLRIREIRVQLRPERDRA